ncbi:transcription repressor NadR [Defluviitalea phaphyphila]|uniref:transcription repressor NadR n=1 Tax=Defluviitalea phaphyphila TaxID=1473580 RepID=UPI0007305F74|nr:transcription repressor NadR [Defluviitalea phaphyphila]
MNKEKRKEEIIKILKNSNKPISGSYLAEKLNVTRQVIVQDIALIRAQGINIMATARGYILYEKEDNKYKKVITVSHEKKDIEDELSIIVDLGGRVINVIVEHPIYGEITANLMIESRRDIKEFMEIMKRNDTVPLARLTNKVHMHTIEAKNETILDEIEQALKNKGYLIS